MGQGRTYIRCEDELPSGIEVEEACQAFLNGKALISMGLLVNMIINDRFEVGVHSRLPKNPWTCKSRSRDPGVVGSMHL